MSSGPVNPPAPGTTAPGPSTTSTPDRITEQKAFIDAQAKARFDKAKQALANFEAGIPTQARSETPPDPNIPPPPPPTKESLLEAYKEARGVYFGEAANELVEHKTREIDQRLKEHGPTGLSKLWRKLGDMNLENWLLSPEKEGAGKWEKIGRGLLRGASIRTAILFGIGGVATAAAGFAGSASVLLGVRGIRAISAGLITGEMAWGSATNLYVKNAWKKKALDEKDQAYVDALSPEDLEKHIAAMEATTILRGDRLDDSNPFYRALREKEDNITKNKPGTPEILSKKNVEKNVQALELFYSQTVAELKTNKDALDAAAASPATITPEQLAQLNEDKARLGKSYTDIANALVFLKTKQLPEATAKEPEMDQQRKDYVEAKVKAATEKTDAKLTEMIAKKKEGTWKGIKRSLLFGSLAGAFTYFEGFHYVGAGVQRLWNPELYSMTHNVSAESLAAIGHTPEQYEQFVEKWGSELQKIDKAVHAGYPLTVQQLEEVRNMTSWSGTPLGDKAKGLMDFMNEKNIDGSNVLERSGIQPMGIVGGKSGDVYLSLKNAIAKHPDWFPDKDPEHLIAKYAESHGIDPKAMVERMHSAYAGEQVWVSNGGLVFETSHHALGYVGTDPEVLFKGKPELLEYAKNFKSPTGRPEDFYNLIKKPDGLKNFQHYYEGKIGLSNKHIRELFEKHAAELKSTEPIQQEAGRTFFREIFNRHHAEFVPIAQGGGGAGLTHRVVEAASHKANVMREVQQQMAEHAAAGHATATAGHAAGVMEHGAKTADVVKDNVQPEGWSKGPVRIPAKEIPVAPDHPQLPPVQEDAGDIALRHIREYSHSLRQVKASPDWNDLEKLRAARDQTEKILYETEHPLEQGQIIGENNKMLAANEAGIMRLGLSELKRRIEDLEKIHPPTPAAPEPPARSVAEQIMRIKRSIDEANAKKT